ncbi:MAG: Hsp20/alpha crystallin family protein [Planctomycetota bacterium]
MQLSPFGQGEKFKSWQRSVQDILDEMRKRSFCDYRASGTWLPTVNIYSNAAGYYLCVELAGLERESVSVECPDPRHIRITGERRRPRTPWLDPHCRIELLEIDEGPFQREIDFAEPVVLTALEVSYDRGFLWVSLRKVGAL